MTKVGFTPRSTPLVWKPDPDNFIFVDADLNTHPPGSTPPGSITVTAATIDISGNVDYCSNPSLNPVPGVTLTLTGSVFRSASSDASGNYVLSLIPYGGSYTVTPTKAAHAPGSAGINTVDVIAVQRHFLVLGTPLSGCRLTSANVNGDTMINTVDVIAIQRFFLGLTTGIGNAGKYQFTPASRSYPGIFTSQSGQNYDTLIFGDVASPFADRLDGPAQDEGAGLRGKRPLSNQ
jgi:hypothetical protein